MSFQILNAAWKASLAPMAKLVLVALADFANESGECFPSLPMMVERCGMSDRGIQKQISALEHAGYLRREFRNGRSTVYTVTPEHGSPLPRTTFTPAPNTVHPEQGSPPPPNTVHPTPEHGSPTPEHGSPITATQPPSNRQLNHQGARSKSTDIPDWLPAEAWRDWCHYRQTGKGRFTDKAKALSLRTLTKLHEEGHDARALIELAIERGWQGLYAPRTGPQGTNERPRIAQNFSAKTYTGTPDDELPAYLRSV